jgi:hypothetical protein
VTPTKQSKRQKLCAFVEARPPGPVTGEEWRRIRETVAPVSDGYLRELLREMGVPMEPLVAGVDQSSFDALEASLAALLDLYQRGSGPAARRLVIQAKDHARWASRRAKEEGRRMVKREMVEWMRVWLENPAVFPAWARLRRQAAGFDAGSTPPAV